MPSSTPRSARTSPDVLRTLAGKLITEGRLGALPAAFNPPTRAHLGLADAAARQYALDQVVFILPQEFPHKRFEDTSFDDRLAMLRAAVGDHPDRAIASCSGGLFIEIARDLRAACGPSVEIALLCGRDAAERIVGWDYGDGPSIARQLEEYELLAGARDGEYRPPKPLASRARCVDLPPELEGVSSSAVRRAIRAGRPWRHHVPAPVADLISQRRWYL